MKTFHGIDELEQSVGTHIGYSQWHAVTQEQIDLFADATGDRQWIHVDPQRAAEGPFGAPIAHGYLTLSMISMMLWEVFTVEGLSMTINYGLNKVRFPAPAPVGSRLRAGAEIAELARTPSGAQLVMRVTVEREGGDKPVCVAETVALLVP